MGKTTDDLKVLRVYLHIQRSPGQVRRSDPDRAPDDPELVDTKHAMQAEALVAAVEKAMRKAPPMTDDLRQRIIGLLS